MSENKSKLSSDTGTSNTNTSNANNNINPSADTLDFVKNLWGGMQIPGFNQAAGMSIPTSWAQDLDKKIEDLKTVESWLQVNMSTLRGTIQTLEVQRATLVALQSMSATLAGAAKQGNVEKEQPDAYAQQAAWWNLLQDQFQSVLSAVVSDVNQKDAETAATSKPESTKRSVKMPVKTSTKTAVKTPVQQTTSKRQ